MINRTSFFNKVRAEFFNGKLSQQQVDGMEGVLSVWDKSGFTDLRWLAYMLATSYHETAKTMYPIEEYGKGRGRDYGKKLKMSRKSYTYPDKIYFGRGHVQLTWYENYELMGKLLRVPLLERPELALDPVISVQIMFEGMTTSKSAKGDFTGKSLEQYFNKTTEDWVNARRIINGLDKAQLIADYGRRFYKILK